MGAVRVSGLKLRFFWGGLGSCVLGPGRFVFFGCRWGGLVWGLYCISLAPGFVRFLTRIRSFLPFWGLFSFPCRFVIFVMSVSAGGFSLCAIFRLPLLPARL